MRIMPRKRHLSTELSFLLREQNIAVTSSQQIAAQLQERMAGQMHAYLQIALKRMQKQHTSSDKSKERDMQIAELMRLLHEK